MRRILIAALLLCAAPLFGAAPFRPQLPDVEVVTHEGRTVRFYSDLVKDRAVAINFIFTNCSTICPVSGAMFANLQKQSVRGVSFISVSIDPEHDTPKALAAWSKRFRTGPGWTLVTGNPEAIGEIVKALGAATSRPQDHQPLTIIGSDATHVWTRLYGFPGPEKVNALFDDAMRGVSR